MTRMEGHDSSLAKAIVRFGQLTLLGRGAARQRLLKLLDRAGVRTVQTSFRGVSYCFHLDNTIERRAMFGRYDKKELDFIVGSMKSEASVFVDVGANSGFYTSYVLAKAPQQSLVIAIEPNPVMCSRIRNNIRLLDASVTATKRVAIAQCAVSDHEGKSFLNLDAGFGGAHLSERAVGKGIEVPLRTLLDIIVAEGVAQIDALKIDVEGHEDKVLVPFFRAAPEPLYPRAIVIEHSSKNSWSADLFDLFPSWGYRLSAITRDNALLVRRNRR